MARVARMVHGVVLMLGSAGCVTACASVPNASVPSATAPSAAAPRANLSAGTPAASGASFVNAAGSVPALTEPNGRYRFTQADVVPSTPGDSIYRFRDGTGANVSVIRYAMPPDVRVDADSQRWTAREGTKFADVQAILQQQGRIEAWRLAFEDTTRLTLSAAPPVLEHAIGIVVRSRGAERMDVQYLYFIHGRLLKIRGTVPIAAWPESELQAFAREAARRVQGYVP